MAEITKDTLIGEAILINPNIAPVLMDMGMHCLGCPASRGESVEDACAVHGTDADALIEQIKAQDLNAALAGAVDEKLGNTDALKSELAEAVTELRKTAEQITDEQVKDQQLEFNVKVTDAGYKIKGNAVLKENNKEVKIDYSVRISEDVSSISAPSDITRLRDFKDLVASLGGMIGGMMN